MAVEQQRAAEPVEEQRKLLLDRRVIGPVRLVEPLVELLGRDRPPPQIAVLLGPRRDDAEAAAGPRADSAAPRAVDHRGIDLVLGAVAVDRGARRPGDHRAAAALQRPPHEPVDERILKRRQASGFPADASAISQSG